VKPPHACYYIQNKSYFLPPPAEGFDPAEDALTTPCWCLQTHDAFGPDGSAVTEFLCVKARACYQAEVELDV